MEAHRRLKNVSIKLFSNMHIVKIKLLFDYFTLYLLKIFAILNYDDLKRKKKSEFIYLHLGLFRIMGWNGTGLGHIFCPKKK